MGSSRRSGLEGIREDLARERTHVAARSPAYARALDLLPAVLDGREGRYVAAAWEHRTFFAFYERPLLLLAALRDEARMEGPAHPLYDGFVAEPPRLEAITADALRAALDPRRERVYDRLAHRRVSTNETSRAIAWRWPAALAGASGGRRPIALADVGASAGLNLVADALPALWTFEDGSKVPVAEGIHAVARVGLDPAPLDATVEADAEWLRSLVWPGETERGARLEAAIRAYRDARPRPDAPVLVPIRARNVPAKLDLLSASNRPALVLAYQTVMRDYVEPDERAEYEAGMEAWIATHPPGQAVWIELEAEGDDPDPARAAAITAHVRAPGGGVEAIVLARCGLHPVRLVREPGGPETLRALLAGGTFAGLHA